MLSKLSETYSKNVALNINLANLPQDVVVLNDSVTVKTVVKAIGFNLLSLEFSKSNLQLDINEDLSYMNNSYMWISEKGKYKIENLFGNGFEVVSVSPDTLIFELEKMATKKVPVLLNGTINFALGYDSLEPIGFRPDSIALIGPSAVLNDINSIETEKVNLTNVKSDISDKFNLNVSQLPDNVNVNESVVEIRNTIEKFTEGKIQVSIEVINIPEEVSINFFPKTVDLKYGVALKDYKVVKESDFRVVCDYSEMELMNSNKLIPKLKSAPDKIKNIRIQPSKVDFIIKE